jgi:hypothetical protein
MAEVRTAPVIEDTGSEEVKRLRKSYNALLDALGTFMDSLEAATADATVQACATAFLASVETDAADIVKIGGEPNVVDAPKRAVSY